MTEAQRKELDKAVWVDPERMSGAPCFRGTRVPVQSLIDLLEGGETIDTFLSLYPEIKREQVMALLDFANEQLIRCAYSLTNAQTPELRGFFKRTKPLPSMKWDGEH